METTYMVLSPANVIMHARATGVIQVMPGAHANSITAYVKHREGELVLQSTCSARLTSPATEFVAMPRTDRCNARTCQPWSGTQLTARELRIDRSVATVWGPPCGRARLGFRALVVVPGPGTQHAMSFASWHARASAAAGRNRAMRRSESRNSMVVRCGNCAAHSERRVATW
jgi:hypothetical protein